MTTAEPQMTQEETDQWVLGLHGQIDEVEAGKGYVARCYECGTFLVERADPQVPVHCERHPTDIVMRLTKEVRASFYYVQRRARTHEGKDAGALHAWARAEDIGEFKGCTRLDLHDVIHYLARWDMLPAKVEARPITIMGAKQKPPIPPERRWDAELQNDAAAHQHSGIHQRGCTPLRRESGECQCFGMAVAR